MLTPSSFPLRRPSARRARPWPRRANRAGVPMHHTHGVVDDRRQDRGDRSCVVDEQPDLPGGIPQLEDPGDNIADLLRQAEGAGDKLTDDVEVVDAGLPNASVGARVGPGQGKSHEGHLPDVLPSGAELAAAAGAGQHEQHGEPESWICRKTVARTAGSLLSTRAMFASGLGAPLSATQTRCRCCAVPASPGESSRPEALRSSKRGWRTITITSSVVCAGPSPTSTA